MEIGKKVFEMEKDDPSSPVAELCQKIIAAQETIASLNAKIQLIKTDGQPSAAAPAAPTAAATTGKKFCPSCGAEIVGDAKFCQGCGSPIN
jgi:membrane protease subunit (stomatin/prohibitin family)